MQIERTADYGQRDYMVAVSEIGFRNFHHEGREGQEEFGLFTAEGIRLPWSAAERRVVRSPVV